MAQPKIIAEQIDTGTGAGQIPVLNGSGELDAGVIPAGVGGANVVYGYSNSFIANTSPLPDGHITPQTTSGTWSNVQDPGGHWDGGTNSGWIMPNLSSGQMVFIDASIYIKKDQPLTEGVARIHLAYYSFGFRTIATGGFMINNPMSPSHTLPLVCHASGFFNNSIIPSGFLVYVRVESQISGNVTVGGQGGVSINATTFKFAVIG